MSRPEQLDRNVADAKEFQESRRDMRGTRAFLCGPLPPPRPSCRPPCTPCFGKGK